jgi:hypothetical protein
LEWFVKNPSCETIEVSKIAINCSCEHQSKLRPNSNLIKEYSTCHERNHCDTSYKITTPEESMFVNDEDFERASLEDFIDESKEETLEEENIFKNKKWYSENGTVYNEKDETVKIALIFNNGSYMSLPIEIADKISQLLNN